ncbi:MAG TPA: hypothetical protein VKK30_06200 [Actinomycetota bacterium]|nr:hypothetical protein [Actinomycetota bacterium]
MRDRTQLSGRGPITAPVQILLEVEGRHSHACSDFSWIVSITYRPMRDTASEREPRLDAGSQDEAQR